MLKHQYTINLGLAALLVAPAAVWGRQEPIDLEERLSATVEAIGDLVRLEKRLGEGDTNAIADILAATEESKRGPRERDEFLEHLRREVSGLQMTYDELTAPETAPIAGQQPLVTPEARRQEGHHDRPRRGPASCAGEPLCAHLERRTR